eukprot:XP_002937200.2 PREDICTED: cyclic GMP-AMP synthase [Xenopus tropicalis]
MKEMEEKSPKYIGIKRQTSSKINSCTTEAPNKSKASGITTGNSTASRKNSAKGEACKASVSKSGKATEGTSSNRTPDKAGNETAKTKLKDTKGKSKMKAPDNESAVSPMKATEGKEMDGAKDEASQKPVKTITKPSAGIKRNGASDKADKKPVGTVENAATCIQNNGALDKQDRTGEGNKALDYVEPEMTVRKLSTDGENKALQKADVEPLIKGKKAINMANKANAEPGSENDDKLTKHLNRTLKMQKLKMDEISKAAEQVKKLVKDLDKFIKSSKDPAFEGMEILNTGSYYEKVKISKPNEFDIMLKIPCGRLRISESDASGSFYTLTINRNPKHPLTNYVENGKISGQQMLDRLRELIKSKLSRLGTGINVERRNAASPAVTIKIGEISVDLVLALEVEGSWPSSTSEGMKIETWLGAKVKRDYKFEPMYFVAKQLKNTEEILWRISFSHIEKEILKNHGNAKTCCETEGVKCCRKQCLKLMKYLLEQLKSKGNRNMTHFCSYHAKTALLHSCTLYPKDDDWRPKDLAACFDRYIEDFMKCLKDARLPNFFIPSLNLFSEELIPKKCLDYLLRKLDKQKKLQYTLFDQ